MTRNVRTCPRCGCDSYVANSRISQKGIVIRRRVCQECGAKWSTGEIDYKLSVKITEFMEILEKEQLIKYE